MKSSWLTIQGLIISAIIIAGDQISKYCLLQTLALEQAMVRGLEITSFFNLVLVWNRGISFGLFNQDAAATPYLLIALAAVLVAAVGWWLVRTQSRVESVAFGLIIGGAIGNVIDRIRFGAVIDFLDFHIGDWHYPAFNVADSAIVIGAGLILCLWGLQGKKDA